MKLILEQLSGLRRELEKDLIRQKEYREYFSDREIVDSDSTFASQVGDGVTEARYNYDQSAKEEHYNLLFTGEYVTERNTDEIDIGTKFSVLFDGEEEKEDYTLVEELTGLKKLEGYTSTKSLFGKAVNGKKEQEKFSYRLENKMEISGTIIEIKKDLSEYPHFIKEKGISCRKCILERKRVEELKEKAKTDENAKKELEERETITTSQISILEMELKRLESKKNRKDADIRAKIAVIKKLLKEATIAVPPTNGTIGVGSKFKINFLIPEEKEMEVELINRAVTTETTDAYIERISSLGSRLYGLKENQEFAYYNGTEHVGGIVSNIENQKIDAKVYKK